MKRTIYLFFMSIATVAISSCNKDAKTTNTITTLDEEQYIQILQNVENLNNKYGCTTEIATRSSAGRGGIEAAADIAGGIAGHYWGTDVGAAVGSVGGVPGAIVGGLLGKKFGELIGSTVASYVAGVIFNAETNTSLSVGGSITKRNYDNSSTATLGLRHNEILDSLINNGIDYTMSSGELNISKIFDDAIQYAEGLDLDMSPSMDTSFREYMEGFSKSVEYTMTETCHSRESVDFEGMLTKILDEQSINLSESVISVYDNLLNASVLDEKSITAYESEYIAIIDNSNLKEFDKNLLSTTGSVAIRSGQFWNKRLEVAKIQ